MAKRITAFVLALVLLALLVLLAGYLLMPPQNEFGCAWNGYLAEPRDSLDVLFFGSSISYCDAAPGWLWDQRGIRSFNMGGPEQTVPLTYFYVREALRTQSPRVAVIEATGMFFNKYQDFTKVNVGYMPPSVNRLRAVFEASEPSARAGLLLPVLEYHGRWREVTAEDIRARLTRSRDVTAGHTALSDSSGAPEISERPITQEAEVYAENLAYMRKISEYCAENGAEIFVFIAPTRMPLPDAERERLRTDLAELGIELHDMTEDADSLGIDPEADWYDAIHLNEYGAEKFSRALADILAEEYGLADGGEDAYWDERTQYLLAACGHE